MDKIIPSTEKFIPTSMASRPGSIGSSAEWNFCRTRAPWCHSKPWGPLRPRNRARFSEAQAKEWWSEDSTSNSEEDYHTQIIPQEGFNTTTFPQEEDRTNGQWPLDVLPWFSVAPSKSRICPWFRIVLLRRLYRTFRPFNFCLQILIISRTDVFEILSKISQLIRESRSSRMLKMLNHLRRTHKKLTNESNGMAFRGPHRVISKTLRPSLMINRSSPFSVFAERRRIFFTGSNIQIWLQTNLAFIGLVPTEKVH
jgi:hypothetical protein